MTFSDPHLFSMTPANALPKPNIDGRAYTTLQAVDRFVSSAFIFASCVVALMAWL